MIRERERGKEHEPCCHQYDGVAHRAGIHTLCLRVIKRSREPVVHVGVLGHFNSIQLTFFHAECSWMTAACIQVRQLTNTPPSLIDYILHVDLVQRACGLLSPCQVMFCTVVVVYAAPPASVRTPIRIVAVIQVGRGKIFDCSQRHVNVCQLFTAL